MRHRGIKAGVVVLLAVGISWLGGCAEKLERFEFRRLEMGVAARIVTYARSPEEAEAGAAAAFARIAELDACMSDYRLDSELMMLSTHRVGEAVPVSRDLYRVLAQAEEVSRDSGGAFDVTVGPEVALWRLARTTGQVPAGDSFLSVVASVGWHKMELGEARRTVTLTRPGMRLDLGGIAKGYAAQQGVEELRRRGLSRSLVALSGDIVVGDPPRGQRGWRVDTGAGVLVLSNAAVSTSGDAEQFVEIDGRRYSHIIDPRSGVAMQRRMNVTIVAPRGEVADALATAVCVMEGGGGVGAESLLQCFKGTAGVLWFEGWEEASVIDPQGVLRWAPARPAAGPGSAGPPPRTPRSR